MNFAQKQAAARRECINIGIRFGEQRTLDFLECALHRKGWGYDRIMDLLKEMAELDAYYLPAFTAEMESDVYQERLDNELRDIVKNRCEFIPFEKRYPEVHRLGYDKLPRRKTT